MALLVKVFREEPSDYFHYVSWTMFWRVIVIGALSGVLVWGLAAAIDKMLLTPTFCSDANNFSICANSTVLASYVAAILVAVMVIPILAVIGIKRPFLVALAATASVWGQVVWSGGNWVAILMWSMLAYAAVYAALVWLNRIRGNVAAVIVLAVFVVLARLVLAI